MNSVIPRLFLWLSIFILSGSSITTVVFGYIPFDTVVVEQRFSGDIDYNRDYGHGHFISISTEGSGKDNTEYICNKLLETCNLDADSEDDINSGKDIKDDSDEIVNKYFEHGSVTDTPFSTNTSSNILNETEQVQAPTNVTTNILNETEQVQAPTNVTNIPNNFEVYMNADVGINMTYPTGWEKIENNTDRFSAISFLSPIEDANDRVHERLLIRVNNQPTELSLDEYSEKVKESLSNNTNFRIISLESTSISDNPAYSLMGVSQEGDQSLQVIDIWTIKDGIVYRIVFYSEDEKADTYEPVVQKMIDSFRITK